MKKKAIIYGLLFCVAIYCTGCSKDILDPTQIGRFRPTPVVNVILNSLWVGDEPDPTYAGAEEPRPEDLLVDDKDYTFGTGDLVQISIYEHRELGTPYIQNFMVNETGHISIPGVGIIPVADRTEIELENEIYDILNPGSIIDPEVTVTMIRSEKLIYWVNGEGVGRTGEFEIPRHGFRLSRAIATAGSVAQFNVSYIYVSRDVTGEQPVTSRKKTQLQMKPQAAEPTAEPIYKTTKPVDKPGQIDPEEEMFEIISPSYEKPNTIITLAEMAEDNELESLAAPEGLIAEEENNRTEQVEWVFEDGRWVPVRIGASEGAPEKQPDTSIEIIRPPDEEGSDFGWEEIGAAGKQRRVIKIPTGKLLGGDPMYDIIIRPGDSISVPVDVIGEFFVMGNLNRNGNIPLTGRPINLKQAISLAGGLGPLAWPQKVEVTRRLKDNRELTVMVDLDKIAKGQQPDFFIKEHDLINVGTHGSSRYLAVLRNAFRAFYGFGFVYDRNFSQPDLGQFDTFDLKRFTEEVF